MPGPVIVTPVLPKGVWTRVSLTMPEPTKVSSANSPGRALKPGVGAGAAGTIGWEGVTPGAMRGTARS